MQSEGDIGLIEPLPASDAANDHVDPALIGGKPQLKFGRKV